MRRDAGKVEAGKACHSMLAHGWANPTYTAWRFRQFDGDARLTHQAVTGVLEVHDHPASLYLRVVERFIEQTVL